MSRISASIGKDMRLAALIAIPLCVPAVTFAQNPPSAPEITLSANGSREADALRGSPVLVRAVVQHSRQFAVDADPIDVSHGDAGWSSAVALVVVDSQGNTVNWKFQVTASQDSILHLDGSSVGAISWRVAPEDTAQIPSGVYQLTAVLDNTDMPAQGWQGNVVSVAAAITVKDAPATLSPSQDAHKAELLANYYALSGDLSSALAALDDLFTRQPDEIDSLTLRGMLLELQGNNDDALASYEHALSAFQVKYPNASEPPKSLLRLRSVLQTKLQIP